MLSRFTRAPKIESGFTVTFGNALRIALGIVWAHKLRSILTIFGIIVGITAVVLIGATLDTVRLQAVRSTAQTIGADTFIISRVATVGNLSRKELSDKLRKNPEIYRREAEQLAAKIKDFALAAPTLDEIADVKRGNRTFLAASITGSASSIQAIRNIGLSSGRFFTEAENRHSSSVAVIGQDLVEELCPTSDPVG